MKVRIGKYQLRIERLSGKGRRWGYAIGKTGIFTNIAGYLCDITRR